MLPLVIGALLTLAAFLRLWDLGSASFTYDSARLNNLAVEFIDTGRLPTRGMMSSAGVENPPLAVYLMSLPNLVSRDPAVSLAFIALLNIFGVWMIYRFGRRYWGVGVGLLAALLLAVGPWAVFNSHQLQAQDMLVPGVLLFFVLLYAWCVDRRPWALTGALVMLAALTQLHFAAFALLPIPALVLLVVAWARWRGRGAVRFAAPLAAGIALSILLYLPYLISDAAGGWQNVRRAIEYMQGPRHLWQRDIFDLVLMNIGGRNIHALAGAQVYTQYLQGLPPVDYLPDRIEEALAVVATVWLAVRLWRARRQPDAVARDGLVLLWLLVPLAVFLRSSSYVPPHYLLSVLPVPYLVLGIAANDLVGSLRQRHVRWVGPVGWLGALALAALVIWQAWLTVSIYRFVGTRDTPGAWGTPIRILSAVADNIRRYADLYDASQVLVLCPGADPRWEECPAVLSYLTSRSHRASFMDYDDPAIWSHAADEETLVVLAPGSSRAATELPQFASLIPEASVPLREHVDEYRFFRIHNPYQDIAQRIEADGATLVVLVGRGQETELKRFYHGSRSVLELPEPGHTAEEAIARLEQIGTGHVYLAVLFRVSEEVDPAGRIEAWLRAHTYEVENAWLGTVRLAGYLSPGSDVQQWLSRRLDADLGGQLRLRGCSLSSVELRAGEPLLVLLEWEVVTAPDEDYTAWVQLWDDEGRAIAQRDVPVTADGRLTSAWQPDDRAETHVGLMIPDTVPPGQYRLVAGAYDSQTGRRLPVSGSDHIEVEVVRIKR